MNPRQHLGGGLIELRQHRDDVLIAGLAELGVATPAIGVGGFATAEVLLDEGSARWLKRWGADRAEPGRSRARASPRRRRRSLSLRRPDPVCPVPDHRHSSHRSRPRRTAARDWAGRWRCGSSAARTTPFDSCRGRACGAARPPRSPASTRSLQRSPGTTGRTASCSVRRSSRRSARPAGHSRRIRRPPASTAGNRRSCHRSGHSGTLPAISAERDTRGTAPRQRSRPGTRPRCLEIATNSIAGLPR